MLSDRAALPAPSTTKQKEAGSLPPLMSFLFTLSSFLSSLARLRDDVDDDGQQHPCQKDGDEGACIAIAGVGGSGDGTESSHGLYFI